MSSHKKAKYPQVSKYVQKKTLITTNSLNPLAASIASRFEMFKQFNREFNLKYNDRKIATSQSKTLNKSTSKSRMIPQNSIQPRRLFDEDYRQKYNQIYDKYLEAKQKIVELNTAMTTLKQDLFEFIREPNEVSCTALSKHVGHQAMTKNLQNIVYGQQQLNEFEIYMQQLMQLMEVQDTNDLIETIKDKMIHYKSLDKCSYRVLDLQSQNKRLFNDFEDKLNSVQKNNEQILRRERNSMQEENNQIMYRLHQTQQQLIADNANYTQLKVDLTTLARHWRQSSLNFQSSCGQIKEIYRVIGQLYGKLKDIEVDAEENMFRLFKSNQEIKRFEKIMEELKHDMSKQIDEKTAKIKEYECTIDRLRAEIESLKLTLDRAQKTLLDKQYQLTKKISDLQDELNLVATAAGIQDIASKANLNHVILKIKQSHELIKRREVELLQCTNALSQRDKGIKQSTQQSDKMSHILSELKQTCKRAQFEREEYKYLLTNLREQVAEIRRQHAEEINRVIQQKDHQILLSNQDILEDHSRLTNKLARVTAECKLLKEQVEESKAEKQLMRNKIAYCQQTNEKTRYELEQQRSERLKYQKCCEEIEASFKEVANLEEQTSQKLISLQHQNKDLCSQIKQMQQNNIELDRDNNKLISQYNTCNMELQRCQNIISELRNAKDRLQQNNLELRLHNIGREEEHHKFQEESNSVLKENRMLKNTVRQLQGEIKRINKKSEEDRKQLKKTVINKLKGIIQKLQLVEKHYQSIKRDINVVRTQFSVMVEEYQHQLASEVAKIELNLVPQAKNVETAQAQTQKRFSKAYFQPIIVMCSQMRQQIQQIKAKLAENKVKSQQYQEAYLQLESKTQESLNRCKRNNQQLQTRLILITTKKLEQVLKETGNFRAFVFELTNQMTKNSQQIRQKIAAMRSKLKELSEPIQRQECATPVFTDAQKLQAKSSPNMTEQDQQNCKSIVRPGSSEGSTKNEAKNVNYVLQLLKQNDNQEPNLPYSRYIRQNFMQIRSHLSLNRLRLDLSGVECRVMSNGSPSSVGFCKDLIQSKLQSEAQNNLKKMKQSDEDIMVSQLQAENQQLKEKIQNLQCNYELLEERYNEINQQRQKLQRKNVQLENATSIKALESTFGKLLQALLDQKVDLFEQTCRLMMKIIGFSEKDIISFEEEISKKKKKKTGFFAGLFKNH